MRKMIAYYEYLRRICTRACVHARTRCIFPASGWTKPRARSAPCRGPSCARQDAVQCHGYAGFRLRWGLDSTSPLPNAAMGTINVTLVVLVITIASGALRGRTRGLSFFTRAGALDRSRTHACRRMRSAIASGVPHDALNTRMRNSSVGRIGYPSRPGGSAARWGR